jgi:hypothetical protein
MSAHGTDIAFAVVSNENVTYTGTAGTSSAFASGINHIRLAASTACYYKLGATPTATTSDTYLPANIIEIIRVNSGQKISFIQVSAGGTASVSQMSK